MKWDFNIEIELSHGRKRIFSLRRFIPILGRWHKRRKEWARSCYSKTRYPSELSARNAEWFKQRPHKPFDVYNCAVCEGFHITTKVSKCTTEGCNQYHSTHKGNC